MYLKRGDLRLFDIDQFYMQVSGRDLTSERE
jgi:hypothetical protein